MESDRRGFLKGLVSVSALLSGCSGTAGDPVEEDRLEPERGSETAMEETETVSDEVQNYRQKLNDYVSEFSPFAARYPAFTSEEGNALLNGLYMVDSSDQQFRFGEARITELSPEEEILSDRISYEMFDTRNFSGGNSSKLSVVDSGLVENILGEGEQSIRAPVALKLDAEKASEFTGLRSPSMEASRDLEKVEKIFGRFHSEMTPVYENVVDKARGDDSGAAETLAEDIRVLGSAMYSLKHGLDRTQRDLPGIRNYSNRFAAGMQSMPQGRVIDGSLDINGDGEIDLHDAHALSWLKNSPVFQEAYGRRLGQEGKIGSEQVAGFAEDTSFFDGQSDDTYRVFYEQGEAGSIEGAIQAIKAADFLQGGDGNPEIEVRNKPVDVEGETPQELLDDFNSYADSTSADYNILLASGMEDLSTTGYSEIGGENVEPVQRNAGMILEPGEVDKRGVPLATSSADGVPISYVAVHEISHAKGGKHYDMVVEDTELDQVTVSLVDVMYDGHRNSLEDEISEESDAVCFLPVALDDYMAGF